MMYPKPKSAPGRFVQSKFVKNRTNAMKEIEAWVKKDDDRGGSSHEASRMSGQLTDNVTEERMLRAKLWELSKERYKVSPPALLSLCVLCLLCVCCVCCVCVCVCMYVVGQEVFFV